MSVTHSVVPFENRLRETDVLAWLGFEIPDTAKIGRYPTLTELSNVIDQLQSYSAKYQEGTLYWVADVFNDEYPVLTIEAVAFSGNLDQPQKVRFSGDREVLTQILKNLPQDCGTFLVTTEGEDPEFVTSGDRVF